MFNPRLQDELSEGRRRYGSTQKPGERLNGPGEKCSRCGDAVPAGTGAHRDYDVYCNACCKAKGYETDAELKEQRNDRDMGDYAKCSCGDEKAIHTEADGGCFACACKGFKAGRENAQGKLVVEGGDSNEVAFVDCETCDEGIDESRIQEHLKDGHTVIKVMKVLKNDNDDTPAEEGETASRLETDHEKGKHKEQHFAQCPLCNSRDNDTTLGYDYATTTTTATPGHGCAKCGHIIGQKFADGLCPCDCHVGGRENVDNTQCDICRQEEGAGLEEHLVSRHGLASDVATVVAHDMEERRNVNEETVVCHICGDRERRGVADLTSKGWLCEACQEKFVKDLTKDD